MERPQGMAGWGILAMVAAVWHLFVLAMAVGCLPWAVIWWAIDHDIDWKGGP